jgi:uncharacterized membrane protein
MTDPGKSEDVRTEARWLLLCATVAVGALVFATLIGNFWGDVLAFIVAAAAGWLAHLQWRAALSADMRRRRETRRAARHSTA